MLTINRNKSYLHYIAETYAQYNARDSDNICRFMKHVFQGLLVISLIIIVSSLLLLPFVDFAAWYWASILYNQWIQMDQFLVVLGSAYLIIALMVIIAIIFNTLKKRRRFKIKNRGFENVDYSAFDLWIKSLKEKTCFQINFVGKDEDLLDMNWPPVKTKYHAEENDHDA